MRGAWWGVGGAGWVGMSGKVRGRRRRPGLHPASVVAGVGAALQRGTTETAPLSSSWLLRPPPLTRRHTVWGRLFFGRSDCRGLSSAAAIVLRGLCGNSAPRPPPGVLEAGGSHQGSSSVPFFHERTVFFSEQLLADTYWPGVAHTSYLAQNSVKVRRQTQCIFDEVRLVSMRARKNEAPIARQSSSAL